MAGRGVGGGGARGKRASASAAAGSAAAPLARARPPLGKTWEAPCTCLACDAATRARQCQAWVRVTFCCRFRFYRDLWPGFTATD
jgi:hypothetical protein